LFQRWHSLICRRLPARRTQERHHARNPGVAHEPGIDYVVTKIPRFAFEKFPQADPTLTTQMKSVGEAMAIGRTFKESLQKCLRSLEIGRSGLGGDGKPWRIGTEGSTNHRQSIFFKLFVRRHHRQVIQFRRGDDKPVKGIIMNPGQVRSGDTNLEIKGKNGQSMMFRDPLKPFFHRVRQLQLARTGLQGDFKTTYGGNINCRGFIDFLQRGAA